ncbi:MAG: hypothetical protein IJH63_10290 [Methanobrevibacter sp.]|nr:hypothetical protein [Methanosphaera sp.]MBR0371088.1 hypothetical protein [Methanobrevibacter sp.]
MLENFEDNELRNLYRKNGVYKVIKNLNDETHVFAVFYDIEKAIIYRDLFEDNEWNINLKGITDINNSPIKPLKPIINHENKESEIIDVAPEKEMIEDEPIKMDIPEDYPPKEIEDKSQEPVSSENISEEESVITNDESFEEFDDKYIHFDKTGYNIIKSINGKDECFGTYNTLDEAITARDYLREHNWEQENNESEPVKVPVKERPKRYVYEVKGVYYIRKKIDDEVITFGHYESLEEAMTARDYFEEHNWDPEDISKFYDEKTFKKNKNPNRYIRTTKYGYQISKDKITWGSFDTIEEAIVARDFLEEHDFSLEYKDKYRKKKQVSDNYFENTKLF